MINSPLPFYKYLKFTLTAEGDENAEKFFAKPDLSALCLLGG